MRSALRLTALILVLIVSGCATLGTPGTKPIPVLGGDRPFIGAGSFGGL